MDAAKQSASKALLCPLANSGEDIFLVFVALLALLHFTTQVRARIKPVVIIGVVQVMQLVQQATEGIFEQANLLTWLHSAQHDPHQLDATMYLI
ncbi:hypothetical protein D3C76_459870 [compost metagenome]